MKMGIFKCSLYGPLIVKNIEMFLRGLKSTQKSIHDTEAETEKEEEVRIKFFKTGSVLGHFWVWAE